MDRYAHRNPQALANYLHLLSFFVGEATAAQTGEALVTANQMNTFPLQERLDLLDRLIQVFSAQKNDAAALRIVLFELEQLFREAGNSYSLGRAYPQELAEKLDKLGEYLYKRNLSRDQMNRVHLLMNSQIRGVDSSLNMPLDAESSLAKMGRFGNGSTTTLGALPAFRQSLNMMHLRVKILGDPKAPLTTDRLEDLCVAYMSLGFRYLEKGLESSDPNKGIYLKKSLTCFDKSIAIPSAEGFLERASSNMRGRLVTVHSERGRVLLYAGDLNGAKLEQKLALDIASKLDVATEEVKSLDFLRQDLGRIDRGR